MKDNPKGLELCSVKIKSALPDLYKDDNKKDVTESNKGKVDVLADVFSRQSYRKIKTVKCLIYFQKRFQNLTIM